ncbi:MAG: polysaccharide deacetylase family protein [Acutalibacteraceae bacterium]|nr:polysaccharide deacetylase family protein [Acutalibacteraceae bacterium]
MRYRFLRFPNGKPKAVTFSYDDGCRDDINTAKIFSQYGVKGTFNINSGYVGQSDWYLNYEEIKKEIIARGHEIAVHGEYHKAPGVVPLLDGMVDCLNCRLQLEKEFDTIIRGMAYPNSGITRFLNNSDYSAVKEYLKNLDIVYSRSLCGDNNSFDLPNDWYNWVPTIHHDNPNSLKWAQDFVQLDNNSGFMAYRMPRLFYVWGHSYEFRNKNNWEHLHDLLKILADREDIWYATNIEIYEYVEAFNRLITSADGRKIYNPTTKKIWLVQDEKDYCIEPDETLTIQ